MYHIVRQRSIVVVAIIIEIRIADPRAACLLFPNWTLPLFARRYRKILGIIIIGNLFKKPLKTISFLLPLNFLSRFSFVQ
jgi:hypothetical protein